MSPKPLVVSAALTALLLIGAARPNALAQTNHRPGGAYLRLVRQARPRIVVTPGRLLYRRCVDWLELQHRPSGTVLFPEFHCWWVRG